MSSPASRSSPTTPRAPSLRRRAFLLLLLLLAVLALLAIRALVPEEMLRRRLGAALEAQGLRAEIGAAQIHLLPPGVGIDSIAIGLADEPGAPPLLRADRIEATLALAPLLRGRLRILDVEILRPALHLPARLPAAWLAGRRDGEAPSRLEVRLDRLRIEDGRLEIGEQRWPIAGEASGLDLEADLAGAEGTSTVRAVTREARLRLRHTVEVRGRVEARARVAGTRLELETLHFKGDEASADLSGGMGLGSPFAYRLAGQAHADASLIERIFGREGWARGPLSGAGEISGAGAKLRIGVDLASAGLWLREIPLADVAGRLEWDGAVLRVEGASAAALGGTASASYRLSREAGGWRHRLEVRPRAVDLGPALALAGSPGFPWAGRGSGVIALETGGGSREWTTEGSVELDAQRVPGEGAAGLLGGEARWRSAGRRVSGQIDVRAEGVALAASGTLAPGDSRLALSLRADDLAAFERDFLHPAVRRYAPGVVVPDLGRFEGSASLEGDLGRGFDGWRGRGTLRGEEVTWRGLPLGRVDATVALAPDEVRLDPWSAAGALGSGEGSLAIRLTPADRGRLEAAGRVDGLDLDRLAVWLGRTDLGIAGEAAGRFHVEGRPDALGGAIDLRAEEVRCAGIALQSLQARLDLSPALITLEESAAELAGGRIQAQGTFAAGAGGGIDLRLAIAGIEPGRLWPDEALGLGGAVAGDLRVRGASRAPQLEGDLRWEGARALGHALGMVRAAGSGAPDGLQVTLEAPDWHLRGNGWVALAAGLPVRLSFAGEDVELARLASPYLAPWLEFSGSADLRAAVFGPLAEPERLRAELQALRLEAKVAGVALHSDGAVSFGWSEGVGILRPARVLGPDTDLVASGRLVGGRRGEAEARLEGTIGLELLRAFDPKLDLQGRAQIQAEAAPRDGGAAYRGEIRIDGARVAYAGLPLVLDQISGRAAFSGDELRIESLAGRLGGGEVRGSGSVRFAGIVPQQFRLAFEGRQVSVTYPANLRTVGDFNLLLEDVAGGYRLSGGLEVARGEYRVEFDTTSGMLPARSREFAASPGAAVEAKGGLGERVALDVRLAAPDGLFLRNAQANIETRADLLLGGTLATPQVSGTITALEGGVVYFRDVRYRITGGTVSFAEYGQLDPHFHLEASTTVREWEILLQIDGRLGSFTYELRSYPPLTQEEILSLLISGRTPDEVRAQGGTPLGREEVTNYLSAPVNALLDKGVAQVFGLTQVKLDSYTLNGAADPSARVTLIKDVTPQVRVTFSNDLTSAGGQVYQVEYQVTPKVEVLASRDENSTFGGDFRYTTRGYTYERSASSRAAESAGLPVRSVALEGAPPEERERLEHRIPFDPGDRFRRAALVEAGEEMRRRLIDHGYLEAQVDAHEAQVEGGVDVRFEIAAGPRYTVGIEGADDSRRLRRAWRQAVRDALVPEDALGSAAAAIGAWFRARGYPEAACTPRLERTGEGERTVTFAVETGPRIQVRELVFEGNQAFGAERLRRQMLTREDGAFTRGWLRPAVLADDLEAIRNLYRENGYQGVQVPPAEVSVDRSRDEASIRVRIDEGQRWTIGAVRFHGNSVFSEAQLLDPIDLRPGQPVTRAALDAARTALRKQYDQGGYDEARVLYGVSGDDPAARIITFEIEEGPYHEVGPIRVTGNDHTRSRVITRELDLDQGQPLRHEDLLEAQRRLSRLGIFRSVDVRADESGDSTAPKVVVAVQEAPNLQTSFGAGYDTEQGARGFVQVTDVNFLGRAQRLGGLARASATDQRAEFFFAEPRLFGRPIEGMLSTFWSASVEESFDETRVGVTLQGSRKVRANTYLARYRLEDVALDNVQLTFDPLDPNVRVEDVRLGSVSGSFVRNLLDEPLNPRRGFSVSSTLGIFDHLLGSEEDFLKFFAHAAAFRPLPGRLVWAQALRIGLAEPFGGSAVPLSERFFAGGDTTIRGFARDQVGPLDPVTGSPTGGQALLILNEELRFPLWGNLAGVVFYDAGNVYETIGDIRLDDVRTVLGIGGRYDTPIGPIRLEYGWKLDRRPDESAGQFFFSIGRAF